MYRLMTVFFATALFACGGGQKAGDGPTNPCGGDNPCNPCGDNPCGDNPCGDNPCGAAAGGGGDASAGGDYSGWQDWTRVTGAVFSSTGHGKKPAHLYVPAAHVDWYKNLAEGQKAPVGFQVAKTHYKAMDAAEVTNLMVMTKMQAGYDPDNGDWFYAVYDASGTKAMMAGKLEKCIDCHSASDDTDFLGGMPK